jgi:hypothetical protein
MTVLTAMLKHPGEEIILGDGVTKQTSYQKDLTSTQRKSKTKVINLNLETAVQVAVAATVQDRPMDAYVPKVHVVVLVSVWTTNLHSHAL